MNKPNLNIKTFDKSIELNNRATFIKLDILTTSILIIIFILYNYIVYNELNIYTLLVLFCVVLSKFIALFFVVKNKKNIAAQLINIVEFLTIIASIFIFKHVVYVKLLLIICIITPILNLPIGFKRKYYIPVAALASFVICVLLHLQNFYDYSVITIYNNFQILIALFFTIGFRTITFSVLFSKSYEKISEKLKILNTIQNKAPVGFIISDKANNQININNEILNKFNINNNAGLKIEEDNNLYAILNKETTANKWQNLQLKNTNSTFENVLFRKDKITDQIDLTILQDKSELFKTQTKLKENEYIYGKILDNFYDAILISKYDRNSKKTDFFYNKKLISLLEIKESNPQTNFTEFFAEKQYDGKPSIKKFKELHKDRFEKNKTNINWKLKSKTGKILHANITVLRMFDDKIFTTILLINDKTENYKHSKDLITKESLFNNLIDNKLVGIIIDVNDLKTGIKEKICNKKIYNIFEIEDYESKIDSLKKFYVEKQENGVNSIEQYEKYNKELYKEGKVEFEFKVKTEKGKIKYLRILSVVERIKEDYELCSSLLIDITKEKLNEKTIELQIDKLKTQNKKLYNYLKSNENLESFAYKAAHDLKAPIRNISGFAQLLQIRSKEKLNKEENEFIGFISSSAKNITKLIDDLLDYAIINKYDDEYKPIEIISIINLLEFEMAKTIEKNNISILKVNMDVTVFGSIILIKKLFKELILNAIELKKENEPLNIEIKSKVTEFDILFTFKSNGIGYAKEVITKVFEAFSNITNNKMSLAKIKRIVKQHNCEINLESKEDEYATFNFTLPKKNINEK